MNALGVKFDAVRSSVIESRNRIIFYEKLKSICVMPSAAGVLGLVNVLVY
jgi:hypothetical protein